MKLLFDQLEYIQAMTDNYKGLRRIIQACQLKGIIKPFPYEGEEKLVYQNRFGMFAKVPVPRYIPYEKYRDQVDEENARPDVFEALLADAKMLLTASSTRIGKLASTDEEMRNTLNLPTDMLKKL